MFKRRGRHAHLPRESRGIVRAAVTIAAAGASTALLVAAVGAPPAPAGTPWLPAQARHVMSAAAQLRPVWDGRGTWPDNGVEPLCPGSLAGRHAVAGSGAHAFTVTCERDGSGYAWTVTS